MVQKVLTTLWIDMSTDEGTWVDLTNCLSYFDGCNTCMVSGGVIGWCTKMFCETPAEPQCLEYERTGMDLSGCISYFDGCNNCSVENGRPSACTLMYCETPSEPKCNEYASGSNMTGDMISAEAKANLSAFSNPELGISFSYPSNRWTITQETESNNWSKYLIGLLKNWNMFFVFHNGGTPLARWSFWWDAAQSINNSAYISNFCADKTNCTLHTNNNRIPYVKYYYEAGVMWSDQTKSTLSYYLFNPNSSFHGIILSNDRIPEVSETDLDTIVQSIQFN